MYLLERDNPSIIWLDQIYNRYNYISYMKMGFESYEQLRQN